MQLLIKPGCLSQRKDQVEAGVTIMAKRRVAACLRHLLPRWSSRDFHGRGSSPFSTSKWQQEPPWSDASHREAAGVGPEGLLRLRFDGRRDLHASSSAWALQAGNGEARQAQAVVLSQRISKARDLEELNYLVETYGKDFNYYNITSAIARLPKVLPGSQPTSTAEQVLVDQLLDMAVGSVGDLDAVGASTVLWGLAKLGSSREDILLELDAVLPSHIPLLNAKQIANVIWAYGTLARVPPGRVLSPLLSAAENCVRHSSPQAVANMLWGLARLQLCHTDLLDRLEKRTMQLLKLQKAQGDTEGGGAEYPANPPRVSWPGLGLPTRSFWQQQGFKAQEVSMTVWALANLGRSPPPDLLQEALRHVCKQVLLYKPQELMMLTWGTATLFKQGEQMPPNLAEALQAIEGAAVSKLASFKPNEVSSLMWAFATLCDPVKPFLPKGSRHTPGWVSKQLLEAVCCTIPLSAGSHNAQGLSNVLWSLAASSHVPDDHVIQAVIQEVSKRDLSDFTDQGLSNILWACAEFNFRPGPAVLQALLAEAIGRQSLPSQAIANTLWALAVFDALEPLVFHNLARRMVHHMDDKINLRQVWQAALTLPSPPGDQDKEVKMVLEAAEASWQAKVCSTTTSQMHRDVSITLRLMGVEHQMEAQQTDQRRIDILIHSLKDGGPDVALEVDGATHFAVNKPWHKLGNTALRNRQLERAGLRVVSVHHLDWRDATSMTKREQYLRGLLVDAGAVAEKAGS